MLIVSALCLKFGCFASSLLRGILGGGLGYIVGPPVPSQFSGATAKKLTTILP